MDGISSIDRLEKWGSGSLSDMELLESALAMVHPRIDAPLIVKSLLDRFGGYSQVLAAPPELLAEVGGVTWNVVLLLKLIMLAAHRFARDQLESGQPILSSSSTLLEYCRKTMAYESVEHLRVLYVDKKNRLLADEVQCRGTVDFVPVMPRQVLRRALVLSASGLILVHNHPSGDPTPSEGDILMTRQFLAAARTLQIVVHDHIIVGRQGHRSLRELKLFDFGLIASRR